MNNTQNKPQIYTGLINIGNTCFINSFLQIINHIYELEDIYKNVFPKLQKKNIPETEFFNEWIQLHNLMWEHDGIITPNRFIQAIQKLATIKEQSLFSGFSQNDIHEFILFFIDSLHNSISRKIHIQISGCEKNEVDVMAVKCYNYLKNNYEKNEYSEIVNLFNGLSFSKITDITGNIIHSIVPEIFFILDLPIPDVNIGDSITLYDCIDLFMKEEVMEGENSWWNEKTGRKENIKKKMEFWKFPKILVISFKRFSSCGNKKLTNFIDFPTVSLDLSKYVSGYTPSKYKYDLFGVCNHIGNVRGGHYTACVSNKSGQWIHYNDEMIEINYTKYVSNNAYCLFYRMQ